MNHRTIAPGNTTVVLAAATILFCWIRAAVTAPVPKLAKPAPAALSKPAALEAALGRSLLDASIPLLEIQRYLSGRLPPIPETRSAAEWDAYANRARSEALDRAVFRGEASRWRKLPTRVEWQETIDGGLGYRIKKLRYEAVPGMWIPALLYEPTDLKGKKVPVSLAVNGHDRVGKAAAYKQLRCINQAKRGMIVLNTEYLGMGQLTDKNYQHYRMNQLDLCGTSGLAPFYLVMSRGLDILLSHENADPTRVAVQGLSGGGWQTITISALDTRVTLCNPVAGYSSLQTRIWNVSDLGDSEQNAADLETVVDYTHMTAMLAPRPALLTFNIADDCCFKADHALPLLKAIARPVYSLYGKPHNLRTYVNQDPGTHNYGLDNRQQFYGMLKDFFFSDRPDVTNKEIPSESEIKTPEQLEVSLPDDAANFNSLARDLVKALPRDSDIPTSQQELADWRERRRTELKKLIHAHDWEAVHSTIRFDQVGGYDHRDRWLSVGGIWTLPSVEFAPPQPSGDVILLSDQGRPSLVKVAEELLSAGKRVLTVDVCGFGESKTKQHSALFAIAVSSVGERPLGIQCSQLVAMARWLKAKDGTKPTIVAIGPRSSLIATVAAAIEPGAISGLDLRGAYRSLKQIIEQNLTVEQAPELFCFSLLERFDVPQLVALVAPRPVRLRDSDRHQSSKESANRF